MAKKETKPAKATKAKKTTAVKATSKSEDFRAKTGDELNTQLSNLKKEQFTMDAEFTPSGVARIGQLQIREKFAYIKP